MTTETMNIRAALVEKKTLDKRIEKAAKNLKSIAFYTKDNPYIGIKTPEEFEKEVNETVQSINDMIIRREAINSAVLAANTTNNVKVPKFVSFSNDTAEVDTEEISLAAAINRKNYYKSFLVDNVVYPIRNDIVRESKRWEEFNAAAHKKVNEVVNQRFAGVTNPSQTKVTEVFEEENKKREPVLINPIDAVNFITSYEERVQDYLKIIDNLLSRETELVEITIEY